MLLSEGQMGDHKGACLLLPRLPAARGIRRQLRLHGATPCIPPTRNGNTFLALVIFWLP